MERGTPGVRRYVAGESIEGLAKTKPDEWKSVVFMYLEQSSVALVSSGEWTSIHMIMNAARRGMRNS